MKNQMDQTVPVDLREWIASEVLTIIIPKQAVVKLIKRRKSFVVFRGDTDE